MDPGSIGEAISLAVAPIFLLAGIGALLNVMTARLGRVVDRARVLEAHLETEETGAVRDRHRHELDALGRRMRNANRAIYATTSSALLVCLVVSLLFVEQFGIVEAAGAVAALFVATMATLTLGLLFFLREIAVASRSLQVRRDLLS